MKEIKSNMKKTIRKKLTKTRIIKELESCTQELRMFGVKKIGLFGSFAKGEEHKRSDIDFVITLKHKTFDAYMDLKFFLEKIFKRKVDVVIEASLKPQLRYIKEEAIYVQKL